MTTMKWPPTTDASCRLRRQLLFALGLIGELKLARDEIRALAAAGVAMVVETSILKRRRGIDENFGASSHEKRSVSRSTLSVQQ
jgi:hypothetical protein